MNRLAAVGLLSLTLLTVAGLSACETVVDVSAPPHENQLVAHSFFAPGSPWAVRVSHTVGYTAPEAPGVVDDAVVEVWEGGHLLEQLVRADSGLFVSNAQGPAADTRYTLRVTAPGFPATEGHAVLPTPVPVTNVRETVVQDGRQPDRPRRIVHVEVTLDDPPDEANFYGLGLVQVRWTVDRQTGAMKVLPPSLFGFESDDPVLGESPFAFLTTDKTFYQEAFFTDSLFAGRAHTLAFDVQYDTPPPDAQVVVRRALAVILLSVSEDFYAYWTTAGRQAFVNENPFAEPLRVHSNMTAGFGVFAGFQYRLFPLSVDAGVLEEVNLATLCRLTGIQHPICTLFPPGR